MKRRNKIRTFFLLSTIFKLIIHILFSLSPLWRVWGGQVGMVSQKRWKLFVPSVCEKCWFDCKVYSFQTFNGKKLGIVHSFIMISHFYQYSLLFNALTISKLCILFRKPPDAFEAYINKNRVGLFIFTS